MTIKRQQWQLSRINNPGAIVSRLVAEHKQTEVVAQELSISTSVVRFVAYTCNLRYNGRDGHWERSP